MKMIDKVRRAFSVLGPKHALRRASGKVLYWTLEDRVRQFFREVYKPPPASVQANDRSWVRGVQSAFHFQHLQHLAGRMPPSEFVSVVMSCRNQAYLLPRAIRSVLEQTHASWELIIGDDGSADDTKVILKEFMADSRVRVLELEPGGPARALNACLAEAGGEWIAYIDADSSWDPSYLTTMLTAFREAPSYRIGYSGWFTHDLDRGIDDIQLPGYSREVLLKRSYFDLSVFMHRRELFDELGGFDESLTCLQGWDLAINYALSEVPLSVSIPLAHRYNRAWSLKNTAQSPEEKKCRFLLRRRSLHQHTADIHVVTWPDYRATNPYQTALYSEFARNGLSVDTLDLPLLVDLLDAGKLKQAPVYHLHWTSPILGHTESKPEAVARKDAFLDRLDRFLGLGGKLVWTVHNTLPHEVHHRDVEIALRASIAERAHLILVHAEQALGECIAHYPIPKERVRVVPHGNYIGLYPNEEPCESAREQLGIPAEAVVFLCLGQIRPYKGIEELVDCFRTLSEERKGLHLIVAGQPVHPMQPAVLESATAGLSNVTLRQALIPDAELQRYLNAADFAVLPYRTVLTSGAALLALSFERPVIAPRLGTLSYLLEDGASGLLYSPDVPGALHKALARAADLPSADRGKMQRAALARAEDFGWDRISGEFAAMVAALVDQGEVHAAASPPQPVRRREIEIEQERIEITHRAGRDAERKARLAVVILNYRGLTDTAQAAWSVQRSRYSDYHLYLVDNASDDRSFDVLGRLFPGQTVIQTPRNLGYAGGNNVGIRLALERGAELIWLLNPDTRVPPELMGELVRAADQHDDIHVFGSKIFLGQTKDRLWFAGGAVKWDRGFEAFHINAGEPDSPGLEEPYTVDYVTGASLFFRAAVTDAIGMIPEDYFLYFEETDWCLRAARAGYGVKVLPWTHLFHEKRSESNGLPQPYYLYYYVRNRLVICQKFHPEKLEDTLRLQADFIDPWLARVEQRRPSYLSAAKRLVDAAIEDGLANRRGPRDLTPLVRGE